MTSYDDCRKAIDEHGKRALGEDLQRPMTQLESQILYGLYSFATFCDFGRDVMARRNKRIKRATARLGLIKWACRSLYDVQTAGTGRIDRRGGARWTSD